MSNEHPPIILVKTWCQLLKNPESKPASERAQQMLLSAFGSEQGIIEFLIKHKIQVDD